MLGFASLLALLLASASAPASARVDTQAWFGSAYTPAAAANTLWWPWIDSYEAAMDRELGFAARRLAFSTLRVFLHTLDYELNSTQLLGAVERMLAIASRHGMRAGLVLFDSCWNTNGANATVQCVPIKGRHNGCWYESPLLSGQTSIARYQPYVEGVVRAFGNDTRVAFIEVYNEPRGPGEDFVFALRDAGFRWASALSPVAPVISCWDDSNNTEILDHHEYDTLFKTGFFPAVYANPTKGAVITEGGSRWYQPPLGGDFGSPLTVLNFLEALKLMKAAGTIGFVPGMFSNWITFVGNDNTRWHWNSPDGADEPAIPWDGWLFPDGTPVSHTEAGAARRYVTGVDEFLSFSKFLSVPPVPEDGDAFLVLAAGTAWSAPLRNGRASVGDGLFEASVWVEEGGAVSVILRAGSVPHASGRIMRAGGDEVARAGRKGLAESKSKQQQVAAPPCTAMATCTFAAQMHDTDVCPGGPPGYRDVSVENSSDPLAACAAACCAWQDCTAWIVRELQGTDGNCTDENCCWLKPGCSVTAPFTGATSAFKVVAPGPPLPGRIAGYNVTLDAASNLMTVSRDDGSGAPAATLGVFNLTTLENGLVRGAWNIVRALLETSAADGSLGIRVWFNPMLPETGFVGNASDATRVPLPLPPRLALVDKAPLAPGGMALCAGAWEARIDYASILPAATFY